MSSVPLPQWDSFPIRRGIEWGKSVVIMAMLLATIGCRHMGPVTMPSFESLRARRDHQDLGAEADATKLSRAGKKNSEVELALAMAQSLESVGDHVGAAKQYRAILQRDASHVVALHRLAIMLDQKGKVAESRSLYRRALKVDPDNADILCDQGYSLYLQRDWPQAEASLRAALEWQPEMARAHGNLGLVLARTQRFEQSHHHFMQAGCSAAEAHYNIGFALASDGDFEGAQREYAFALGADPELEVAQKGLRIVKAVQEKQNPGQNAGQQQTQLASYQETVDP